jgi:hypothetical protein
MDIDKYQQGYEDGKVRGRLEVLLAAVLSTGLIIAAWYLPNLIVYLGRD